MNIIEDNPFRILGILSNASAKDIKESETFIVRYLDIGKSADLKFDITPPLNQIDRTSESVENAKRRIHTSLDKLLYSMFWFVDGSLADKIALDKLSSEKNIERALESFKKGCRNFVVSKTSFSSIINFSTLELISYNVHQDEERLKQAIKYKYEIIKNKIVFKDFELLITSSTNKINNKDFHDKFLENVKDFLKQVFPRKDQNKMLLDIFSEEDNISKEIEGQIIKSLEDSINTHLDSFDLFLENYSNKTDSQVISSKSSIINRSKKLVSDTKSDLNKLKRILGFNNFQFINLVDEIYTKVNVSVIMCYNKEMQKLNSDIEYGNKSSISSTSFKSYVDVLQEAANAVSSINCSIKSTIIENLRVIKKVNGELLELKRKIKFSNTMMNNYVESNYSSSSSSGLDGCLGEIIERFIGIAIMIAIFSFFAWVCG